MITIYRYELPDGGGPFMTRDGFSRLYSDVYFDDDTLSGCLTITELHRYFKERHIHVESNWQLVSYDGEKLAEKMSGEILIRKSTAVRREVF